MQPVDPRIAAQRPTGCCSASNQYTWTSPESEAADDWGWKGDFENTCINFFTESRFSVFILLHS